MRIDDRINELIAVGASVTANCSSCLRHHVGKALENGADAQDIAEAITVGKMVRKGAAANVDKLALSLRRHGVSGENGSNEGCGCS